MRPLRSPASAWRRASRRISSNSRILIAAVSFPAMVGFSSRARGASRAAGLGPATCFFVRCFCVKRFLLSTLIPVGAVEPETPLRPNYSTQSGKNGFRKSVPPRQRCSNSNPLTHKGLRRAAGPSAATRTDGERAPIGKDSSREARFWCAARFPAWPTTPAEWYAASDSSVDRHNRHKGAVLFLRKVRYERHKREILPRLTTTCALKGSPACLRATTRHNRHPAGESLRLGRNGCAVAILTPSQL